MTEGEWRPGRVPGQGATLMPGPPKDTDAAPGLPPPKEKEPLEVAAAGEAAWEACACSAAPWSAGLTLSPPKENDTLEAASAVAAVAVLSVWPPAGVTPGPKEETCEEDGDASWAVGADCGVPAPHEGGQGGGGPCSESG